MKKTWLPMLALLSLFAAACGDDDDSVSEPSGTGEVGEEETTDEPAELEGFSVGVYPGAFLNLAEYVALEEGYFENAGLDVELIDIASGPEQIAALASDSIDVMGNTPANIMLANAEGQDMVGVLGAINVAFYTWVAQQDWPTPNEGAGYPDVVKDMRGANIGVTARGAEVELFTRALLEDADLDPDRDVTFVGVGAGAQAIGAFKAKQIDVLVAFEPSQTLLIDVEGVAKPILDLREGEGPEQFKKWPGQMRATLRSKADRDPERFKAYQTAMATAFDFIQDSANKDRVIEIYSKYIELEPEALEALYDNNHETVGPTVDCEALENVAAFEVDTEQLAEADVQPCDEFMWDGAAEFTENLPE